MRVPLVITSAIVATLFGFTVWSKSIENTVFSQSNRHPDYQLLVKSLEGDIPGVRQLLQSGADPNTPPGENDKGMTALMFAAWRGHEEIAMMLLQAGADVNTVAANGSSPLIYAASADKPRVVRELLRLGANPDYVRGDGMIPLMFAVTNRNVETVRILTPLTSSSLLNNSRFIHGDHIIHAAVKTGDPDLVEALIRSEISLDVRDRLGKTPLLYAARNGHTRIVTKLLRKGAGVNVRSSNGVTALTTAVMNNRVAVVQVLRQYGATR